VKGKLIMIIYAVIHVFNVLLARKQAVLACQLGVDGFFLVDHDGKPIWYLTS
jgi:hypothetical protein